MVFVKGQAGHKGYKHSEETKAKLRALRVGKKNPAVSRANKLRVVTEVTRKKMSDARQLENNPRWAGDDATYVTFHRRVRDARGKPSKCSACDRTDDKTRYEWASLTKDYKNINDYIRLCNPCHQRFDRLTKLL